METSVGKAFQAEEGVGREGPGWLGASTAPLGYRFGGLADSGGRGGRKGG